MRKKKNVPELRFKEFSDEWEEKKLGEICEIKKGEQLNVSEMTDEGEYPALNGGINPSGFTNKWNTDGNTISISEGGNSCGYINLLKQKFWSGGHCYTLLNIKEKIDSIYLFQVLKFNQIEIMRLRVGSGLPNIQKKDLNNFVLLIPSLVEQTKIASFLTCVDDKLQALKKKKALLEQYKKGMMQKIFSQELRFKDEKGNDFPEWEEKKLGEICEIKKGEQLNVSEMTDEGEYPALNGGINPSGFTNKWNTDGNTISISEGGNSCGYINLLKQKFWSGGHCYTLLNIKEKIDSIYLFQVLKFNQIEIMRLRVGSGLPNIQKKDLNNFVLLIPSLVEQIKIASLLSSIDEKINQVQFQVEKTEVWKKGLLQKMFI